MVATAIALQNQDRAGIWRGRLVRGLLIIVSMAFISLMLLVPLVTVFFEAFSEGIDAYRSALLERVWGYSYDPTSNIVDVYVRYLRNKLGRSVIETVRDIGYRITRED